MTRRGAAAAGGVEGLGVKEPAKEEELEELRGGLLSAKEVSIVELSKAALRPSY